MSAGCDNDCVIFSFCVFILCKCAFNLVVPWQIGFTEGLAKSTVFLPILSKDAINADGNEKQNFTLLKKTSLCDSVLLEYRLALELREREMISSIYPVFVGRKILVKMPLEKSVDKDATAATAPAVDWTAS